MVDRFLVAKGTPIQSSCHLQGLSKKKKRKQPNRREKIERNLTELPSVMNTKSLAGTGVRGRAGTRDKRYKRAFGRKQQRKQYGISEGEQSQAEHKTGFDQPNDLGCYPPWGAMKGQEEELKGRTNNLLGGWQHHRRKRD